jgi:phosphoserine phosphatase
VSQAADLTKHYLFACDFDQTLSFNDSGFILSELLGIPGFRERVAGLARINLVQQGAELAYLILHDPEFRRVRRDHLLEVGRRIRLKGNIRHLVELLGAGVGGCRFDFYVVSAAPEEVIHSALDGMVPADHIFGTRFRYDPSSGEVASIVHVPAGYGKVAVLDGLQAQLGISRDRVVYVGDGNSDIHVMLHVNRREGFTIAVSESRHIAQIAKRTVLSDDAMSVLIPVLEDVLGWEAPRIRAFMEEHGFSIQEWDRVHTDWITIRRSASEAAERLEAPVA